MEVPKNKNVEHIKELFEEKDRVTVLGENGDGFEAKTSQDSRDWVEEVVESNNVRFDNPLRIQAGHPYILILPESE